MTAEACEPTLTEALQSLLTACLFDLRKGRDAQEVVAKLVINLNPIADFLAEDETSMPTQTKQ